MRAAKFKIPAEYDHLEKASAQYRAKTSLHKLIDDIQNFKSTNYPPKNLEELDKGLNIYVGNSDAVNEYFALWHRYIEAAKKYYPDAFLPPDYKPFPSSLGIPKFFHDIKEVHVAKTIAKESVTLGTVSQVTNKCGMFSDEHMDAMEMYLSSNEQNSVVCHRPYNDMRAYLYTQKDLTWKNKKPTRIRYYNNGLIFSADEDLVFVDSRGKERKKRKDAYKDPIAANDEWLIFKK